MMAKRSARGVSDHIAQLHTTSNPTYLVADSALYTTDNLHKLANTCIKWITRVPATLTEVQEVLAQAHPENMPPLQKGYRARSMPSTYGGVAQRWVLLYSEQRQPQAQRTVDKRMPNRPWRVLSTTCRRRFSTTAPSAPRHTIGSGGDQALEHSLTRIVYHIAGALASRLTDRRALIDQQSCCILATNELDESQLSAQAVLDGYKGHTQVERGFRFLKDPQFLASSLYLKKSERIMALLMVMTVCLLVYAALEYRIRTALKEHGATFPDQKGRRISHPTTRWVFHSFVGIHILSIPGQGPMILHLTDEHQHLLQLLGNRYAWFYR